MRDRDKQVNCAIYKSAPQDEASYDNAVKTKFLPESRGG